MKGAAFYHLLGRMIRERRARRVDVLHTHLTRAAYFGHVFGRLTGTPIVTSVHIANYDKIYRRLAHGTNRLVAVSGFIAEHLQASGVDVPHLVTIPNATDMLDLPAGDPVETRAELGLPPDSRIVLSVGRVTKEKGVFELLGALSHLPPNVAVVLAGRSDPEWSDALDREIARAGLSRRVVRIGERNDIAALLDIADIVAMPSYMETFGMAALEGMARARPVIATRVGGLPEVVLDGETGILVDRIEGDGPRGPDPAALATAIRRLLADPVERERMGNAGRLRVGSEFTLERMAQRFETVYHEALGRDEWSATAQPALT